MQIRLDAVVPVMQTSGVFQTTSTPANQALPQLSKKGSSIFDDTSFASDN